MRTKALSQTPVQTWSGRLLQALAVVTLAAPAAALADPVGDDMLKPDEVDTSQENISNPNNKSGAFLGAGLSFGQARSTEGGASPGVGYLLKVEPGYQMSRGTWGRMEISAELLSGSLSFQTDKAKGGGKVTVPVGFGMLAKFGYGYSLGSKVYGLARIGAGPVLAKVKVEDFESSTVSGLAAQLGWLMVLPMSSSLDATGGISWTHMQFPVDELENGSAKVDYDRTVIANVPAIDVGLRVRF